MFKRSLCILLSVMMLFFCVNNSYFSPHKMDKVEATGAVIVGGATITAEIIIELIAAIGVTALGAAIIDDVKDWDWNAICNDVHDWCRENVAVLDQYVTDGTSALKEWALSDEWVVIEGGGGSPDPSPSPDDDNSKDYSEKVWGASDVWNIGNLIAGAGVLGNEFYNKVVTLDEGIIEVAKQYVNQKINNFGSSTASDPITLALQSRFQPALVEIPDGYAAWSTKEIVKWNFENLGYQSNKISFTWLNSNGTTQKQEIVFTEPVYIIPMITSDGHYILESIHFDDYSYTVNNYINDELNTTYDRTATLGTKDYINNCLVCISSYNQLSNSSPIPFYQLLISNDAVAIQKIGLGLSPNQLFSPYGKNYIDTDGEYGWASTADLSPSDLAQANPALANNLLGKDVSISALVSAINALKNQLEEQNPNINIDDPLADPLPYPDVPTYSVIVNNVVSDPAIFPENNPSGGESSGGSSPSPSPSPEGGGNGDSGNNDGKKWVVDLSKFFPFCIPFDLIHLISALDAEPVAPCWEIPLQLPAYGIDYTFTIDLSSFNDVAKVFRTCETILFVLSLILITRKLIRG